MIPVICIVGGSNSGKTTLLVKLIPELTGRGYRVATVKHAQEINLGPDKDSARHLAAGSRATALVSEDHLLALKSCGTDATLAEAIRFLGDNYDLILCEGFKQADAPKIVVNPHLLGQSYDGLTRILAEVTNEPSANNIRHFGLEDVTGLANFIEKSFLKPTEDMVELYVNEEKVPLIQFPRQIVAQTLLAMVSSLKGGSEIKDLEIRVRRSGQTNKG